MRSVSSKFLLTRTTRNAGLGPTEHLWLPTSKFRTGCVSKQNVEKLSAVAKNIFTADTEDDIVDVGQDVLN